MLNQKAHVEKLLKQAGITINGSGAADTKIHNEKLYGRVMRGGSLALGEAYMEGWWDVKELDQFFYQILSHGISHAAAHSWHELLFLAGSIMFNMQSKARAFEVGQKHYDIGNDLYEAMLDKRMTYTCGYWSPSASSGQAAINLDQAQEAKLDLVCKKLRLKPGDTVLDIGCGWGSFLEFAAQKYSIKGTGITISKEQAALARKRCQGLPIEIKVQDYRDTQGTFNHIVSLGMFEHVGFKNYAAYMKKAHDLLANDGLFLLHTIGANQTSFFTDPWVEKYIFPNGILPSVSQIGKSIEKLFIMEDWHNFGHDYSKTLMAWFENFDRAWLTLQSKYDDRFYRMWKYYLLSFAGSFRARNLHLWQIVLSKHGVRGGYQSVR